MALEIDGFAVLGAIARKPDIFPLAKPDAVKTAKSLVVKQIKDRGLTIASLRAIAEALGSENFDLISDSLSDADIKSMLGKVDKFATVTKGALIQDQRRHLADLAHGRVSPALKATAPTKAMMTPPKKKDEVTRSGASRAAGARRRATSP